MNPHCICYYNDWDKRYLIPFFGLILFWLVIGETNLQANDDSHDSSLEIASADSISIRLFSNERPQELKLSAQDGPITLKFNDQEYVIEDSTNIFKVSVSGRYVYIKLNGRNHRARYLRIENSEVSLVRIIEKTAGYRYYRGILEIGIEKGVLKVLNHVWLEDYIGSVVGSEMNFKHQEALKVQAVIARTYALWNIETSSFDGYDVTDHTMSQVYLGELIPKPRYREAALATTGEILTWSNKLILASFFSTCGDRTVDNESVWNGKPLPYLRAVNDHGACKLSPHYRWSFEIDQNRLHKLLRNKTGRYVAKVAIAEADRFQNVSQMAFYSSRSAAKPSELMQANRFRIWLLKSEGPRSLKSTNFTLTYHSATGKYLFKGKGLGHGVGLCQWGALGLAKSGWMYDDILRFYYKGVEIKDIYEWPSHTIDLAR